MRNRSGDGRLCHSSRFVVVFRGAQGIVVVTVVGGDRLCDRG